MNFSGLKEGDKVGHATISKVTRPKLPKIPGEPKKKGRGKAQRSHLADKFVDIWRVFGDCPYEMVEEYQFHPERKWRFDFCWPCRMVAAELDGGVHTGGRHTRGKGFENDVEKLNAATSMGWVVLRFTARDLAKKRQTQTVDLVRTALGLCGGRVAVE